MSVLSQGTCVPNLKIVSFESFLCCTFEGIAGLKCFQNCVSDAQKDYFIVDDVFIFS